MHTFALRLPKELFEKVRVDAVKNDRSINKQIESILKRHFLEGKEG